MLPLQTAYLINRDKQIEEIIVEGPTSDFYDSNEVFEIVFDSFDERLKKLIAK